MVLSYSSHTRADTALSHLIFYLPLNNKFTWMNYNEQKLKVNAELHRLELEIEASITFIE